MGKHVKLLVLVVFTINLAVLTSLLVILWTLKTVQHDCERICITDKTKDIVCGCRAERLQNHLRTLKSFTEEKAKKEETMQEARRGHGGEARWGIMTRTMPRSDIAEELYSAQRVFKEEFLKRNEEVKGKPHQFRSIDIISFMKPNAHLGGWMDESHHDNKNETALTTLRNWRDDGNDMFLSNGIIHRNGRLVVPYNGVYHVYCFIDMRCYQEGQHHSFDTHSLKYAIFKSNIQNLGTSSEESELLTAFHTPDIPGITQLGVYDNFLSADVELHAGDEIYVKVWNKKFIRYPTQNIFGIHLI